MSARKIAALGALARWRAFEQTLAERSHRRASAEYADARAVADAANARVDAVERHRRDMLRAATLDLAKLECVVRIQEHAAELAARRDLELREADAQRQTAMRAHLDARARTRVVEKRRDRTVAIEADAAEKRGFDRMSALRPASASEYAAGQGQEGERS